MPLPLLPPCYPVDAPIVKRSAKGPRGLAGSIRPLDGVALPSAQGFDDELP